MAEIADNPCRGNCSPCCIQHTIAEKVSLTQPLGALPVEEAIYTSLLSNDLNERQTQKLASAINVQRSVHYWFINVDITVPDLQVKATLRISADPSLVLNSRSLGTKVGKGH